MSSLADLPELVGFFSYSREDDEGSHGALSALRERIQQELRAQLGRSFKTFRLWQDKEAIPSGTLWETEIKNAVEQSVFFIPIITPTVVASPYCRFELDAFLAREAALGRSDLVFPILYIHVPALEDSVRRQNDAVLSLIAKRQYVDWRRWRHRDVRTTDVSEEVERFCMHIRDALHRQWISPEERKAQPEEDRRRHEEEVRRRDEAARRSAAAAPAREQAEHERRQREAEAEQRRKGAAEAKRREDEEAEAKRRAEAEEHRRLRQLQPRPAWRLPTLIIGSLAIVAAIGAIVLTQYPQPPPPPGRLTVSGPDVLTFTGPEGGPFTPDKSSLTLRATGSGFHWSVDGIPQWLSVSPSEGDLAANASAEVTVALTTAAQSLTHGQHSAQLIFRNHSGNAIVARAVNMVVQELKEAPLSLARERALKPKDTFKECATCPKMVVVPAGTFTMGSPQTEEVRSNDEGPQHQVTIERQFAVGQFEVTFDEWDACVANGGCNGYKPFDQGWGRGRRPVINVSWDDAKAYVTWLSRETGKPYRLLSEAEFEYAARAGSRTAYPWGNDIGKGNADCAGCGSQWDGKQTAPVGSFAANVFGLYDMAGNAWEWVEDCYHYNYNGAPIDGSAWTSSGCSRRVMRGGSWDYRPPSLRSANRYGLTTDNRADLIGFRVGRTVITP